MGEKTRPVAPVQVTYECDSCGVGSMEFTGQALLTHPPRYAHACSSCGARENFREQYPLIRYKPVPET